MRMEHEFHPDPASKQSAKHVWHIPIAVYTVLDSWWWTVYLSETYRVLFQNKFKKLVLLLGFYYKNISRCTVLWMSNILKILCPLHDVWSTETTISLWTQQKITETRRTLCIFYYIIYYVNYSVPFMSARSVSTAGIPLQLEFILHSPVNTFKHVHSNHLWFCL